MEAKANFTYFKKSIFNQIVVAEYG